MTRELAPALMDFDAPKPLAVDIHGQLVELGVDAQAAGDALCFWCGRIEYRRSIAAGGPRFGLDGGVAGEISVEDQEDARAAIADLEARLCGDRL